MRINIFIGQAPVLVLYLVAYELVLKSRNVKSSSMQVRVYCFSVFPYFLYKVMKYWAV